MPIWFYFQTFTQESLIAFYKYADVLLVTPLRDGMNLVAKEYITARTDYKGMVVISETAGAASEIGEVVVVNANDANAIASGIKTALEMPLDEKISINKAIHKRLKRYNVEFWASEFINTLENTKQNHTINIAKNIENDQTPIINAYKKTKQRIILLDYDGTLVGFESIPKKAKPDDDLKRMLAKLADDPKNNVVIVSGRDRHTLQQWLGDLKINLLASHGLWFAQMGRRMEDDGDTGQQLEGVCQQRTSAIRGAACRGLS